MIEAGEDLTVVSDVLGRSTIGVTANVYLHLTERAKDRAAERINALVLGG